VTDLPTNILQEIFEWLSLTRQFASFLLDHGHFWNIDISKGSVATYLRRGGKFKYDFAVNLPRSLH